MKNGYWSAEKYTLMPRVAMENKKVAPHRGAVSEPLFYTGEEGLKAGPGVPLHPTVSPKVSCLLCASLTVSRLPWTSCVSSYALKLPEHPLPRQEHPQVFFSKGKISNILVLPYPRVTLTTSFPVQTILIVSFPSLGSGECLSIQSVSLNISCLTLSFPGRLLSCSEFPCWRFSYQPCSIPQQ